MTTTLRTAPAKTGSGLRARADVLARLAVTLAVSAQVVICYLTVVLWRQVDLFRDPVSDYAFFSAGRAWFVVAILLVLLAGLALVMAMSDAGLVRTTLTNVLFGLWAAGLLLVAVFPGNRAADDPTLHGEIHRFGGAVFLTCLPLACWTLATTLAAKPLWTSAARLVRRLSVVGMITAASFGFAQVVPALPEGLLERFALIAELALLVAVATTVRRAAR
ncbi:DUF998 domain-containing protein [Amycolatopsis sp.]|uniref:DUF998 domain-containing protein n=1 Tax=Amycolatopsis sp. TaxID=37632 RepID=UPI002DFCDD2A|nr:DUF998 domain-containing protein [Amycolatopsis sp.]